MSPEMLMQPFEQRFNFVPSNIGYYPHNTLIENEADNTFYLGYQHVMDPNEENFRQAFYNPFEIKHRRRTSRAQLKVLEKSFSENPKPNSTVRRLLAQQLDMTPRGVQIWFQNRRAKAKQSKRKSGQDEDPRQEPEQKEQPNNSPALFNQFFNNLKTWDRTMKSGGSLTSSPCMFSSQDPQNGMGDWLKTPLHPLAPVIESDSHFTAQPANFVPTEEWRRKSCPSLTPRNIPFSWPNFETRRMTADNIAFSGSSECDRNNPIGIYANLNCSPLSQELTPMLSTGSPVSSIDGAYYDNCLDLLITEPSPSL